jgi:chromosome partitioning protein
MNTFPYPPPVSLLLLGKGGGGKTTSALALASLSATMGWRTILLDADPQGSASEWHALSPAPPFAVHTTEVGAVPALLDRAKKRYDVVIIDHPPASYGGTRTLIGAADHCLICARPYRFDVSLALEWVALVQTEHRALVALTAAPPLRLGTDAPIVAEARRRLNAAGAAPWRGQVTHRLVHPELTARGMTVAELPAARSARAEYDSLWSALRKQMMVSAHG